MVRKAPWPDGIPNSVWTIVRRANPGIHDAIVNPALKSTVFPIECIPAGVKAGTDYGTCSAAQPDAAAKNMMFDVLRQSCIAVERTKNCRFSE